MTDTTLSPTVDATAPVIDSGTPAPEVAQAAPSVQPNPVTEVSNSAWYDSLAEDLRANPQLKDFKSLDEFVKSDLNARKLIGKRVQELSPEEVRQFLTPEELVAASRSSDMPASLDQYELNLGLNTPTEDVERIKKQLFDSGITPKQAQVLAELQVQEQAAALEKTKKQWEQQVYDKWGSKSTEVVDLARRAVSEFASPEIKTLMDTSGLGNNPVVIEFLANIASAMQEHKVPHSSKHADGGASIASLKAEINAKLSDKKFYQRWASQERGATQELNDMYQRLYKLGG